MLQARMIRGDIYLVTNAPVQVPPSYWQSAATQSQAPYDQGEDAWRRWAQGVAPELRRRMKRALNEYVVTGVKTTIPFHIRVMNNRHFIEGSFDTNFIDKVFFKEEKERRLPHSDVAVITAAIQVFLEERERAIAQKPSGTSGPVSMWKYSTRPGVRKSG